MHKLLNEWIKKAEGDYRLAKLGFKQKDSLIFDGVCFHCQQCAEKYLKAWMIANDVEFKERHDLEYLLGLIVPSDPSFEFIRDLLIVLNEYAVDIRYPGDFATLQEAAQATKAMKVVRSFVRGKLGLAKERSKKRK